MGLDLGGHFAAADGGNKKGKMMCLKTHVRVVRVVLVGEESLISFMSTILDRCLLFEYAPRRAQRCL